MARIRTIKPDFWTDEKLTECSVTARLFFIGLLNFADDNGNLQRSAKKLKMQVFPADAIDCEPLVVELMAHGILIEYAVNGEKFLHIKGFKKHQVINRPSKSPIPQPPFIEDSVSDDGELCEESVTEGKGREEEGKGKGKGKEEEIATPRAPQCPVSKIIELYTLHAPSLVPAKIVSDEVRTQISARWKQDPEHQSLDFWVDFFNHCEQSQFLTGRSPPKPGQKPFRCGLEWITKSSNFSKIINGNFDD